MNKVFLLFLLFLLTSCFGGEDSSKKESILEQELNNGISQEKSKKMELLKTDFEKDINEFIKSEKNK